MNSDAREVRISATWRRGSTPALVDLRVLILQVNRAGRLAVVQGQHGQHHFQCARPAQQIDIVMNSILLTGLFQRLLIALFALAAVWGMYFWAVA